MSVKKEPILPAPRINILIFLFIKVSHILPSVWLSLSEGRVPVGMRYIFLLKRYIHYFSYHLPLRILLLPEGGEAMQKAYEASVYYLIIY